MEGGWFDALELIFGTTTGAESLGGGEVEGVELGGAGTDGMLVGSWGVIAAGGY